MRAIGTLPKAAAGAARAPAGSAGEPRSRDVWDREAGRKVPWPVHRREAIVPGAAIAGPAIVEEATATTVVPAGWRLEAHPHGHLVMSR